MKARLIVPVILAALVGGTLAHAANQTFFVKFRLGMKSTTMAGDIQGANTATYVIEAKPGQEMSIAFRSDHEGCTFHVYDPEADGPLVETKIIGDGYSGKLPQSGEYAVRVRFTNEAQAAAQCRYSITFDVSG